MLESRVSVWIIAPEKIKKPFRVTLCSTDGEFVRTVFAKANEKAEMSAPDGTYRLKVESGSELNPGSQCKPIHLCAGMAKCYSVIFRGSGEPGEAVTVTIFAEDANYPGIIPINGGMTVWQRQQEL